MGLQCGNECGHGAGFGQPLIDRALLQAAMVGMHELAVYPLAFQGCEQFALQVELADEVWRGDTPVIQTVAAAHPRVEPQGVTRGA